MSKKNKTQGKPSYEREFAADDEDSEEKKKKTADDYIQLHDDGSATILFDVPVKHGAEFINEITLKQPLVGDLEASDRAKGDVQKMILITASLAEVPPTVIRRIAMKDFTRVSKFLETVLGGDEDEKKNPSPATSEES